MGSKPPVPGCWVWTARYDAIPLACTWAQDPVVTHEVEARWRDQRCELLHEFLGLEDDVGGAVAPAVLEAVEEPSILEPGEPLGRDGWACHVAAEAFQAAAVARRDGDVRVQAHAARAGAARALECGEVLRIDAVADAQHAPARAAAGGDATRDGRTVELGEQRLVLGQGVRFRWIRRGAEAAPLEEARDPLCDLAHHPRDLCVVRGRERVEAQGPALLRCVDAVEQQRVEVDVQHQSVAIPSRRASRFTTPSTLTAGARWKYLLRHVVATPL